MKNDKKCFTDTPHFLKKYMFNTAARAGYCPGERDGSPFEGDDAAGGRWL